MLAVQCDQLTKRFGRFEAVKQLSFQIEANKITGLIGHNGAGKTTLLKILAGFLYESNGDVQVFSEQPFNNVFVSANSILIDDDMIFPEKLTLKEILEEAQQFYESWDMTLARRLFNYFAFDDRQFHSHLSKGKKSTFNAIVGLASHCALTMFDEPTVGMDAAVRQDFYRALLKDYLAHPRTIIISSHYLNEIEDLLEDVLLIKNGEKRLHLPIETLQTYALGLSGSVEQVEALVGSDTVLHRRQVDHDHVYVVIENNHSSLFLEQAQKVGIKVSSISPSDLCVYLTNETVGGIDDVFDQA